MIKERKKKLFLYKTAVNPNSEFKKVIEQKHPPTKNKRTSKQKQKTKQIMFNKKETITTHHKNQENTKSTTY